MKTAQENIVFGFAIIVIAIFIAIMLCSCGHNVAIYSKGVGMELAWRPNTIMPSLRFGSYENVDLVQKENNDVRYTSNSGTGFDWLGLRTLFGGGNAAGTSTVLEVKTGPQVNGYVADVLMNPGAKPEHVEIAKAFAGVETSLGDKEQHVSINSADSNTTPVAVTEKGALGNVKTTTPVSELTKDAIREQVKTNGVHDVLKAYGLYIICGIVLVVLILAFVAVHLLEKTSDLKEIVKDLKR